MSRYAWFNLGGLCLEVLVILLLASVRAEVPHSHHLGWALIITTNILAYTVGGFIGLAAAGKERL